MSSDPERPIEKLLRASAKQRKDLAGSWDLHPANRRLLQQEVARKFRPQPGKGRLLSRWLATWSWPKISSAAATVLLVVGIAWWLVPRSEPVATKRDLAQNEPSRAKSQVNRSQAELASQNERTPAKESLTSATPLASSDAATKKAEMVSAASSYANPSLSSAPVTQTPLQPSVPPVTLSDKETPSTQPLALNSPARAVAGPQTVTPSTATGLALSPELAKESETTATRDVTKDAVDRAFSARLSAGAPGRKMASKAAAVSANNTSAPVIPYGYFVSAQEAFGQQRFRQTAKQAEPASANSLRESLGAPGPAPVLTYFKLEQTGSELRVLDSDGSLYTGPIQTGTNLPATQFAAGRQTGASLARSRAAFAPASASQLSGQTSEITNVGVYSFEVTGTNRTSQQKVVFTGQILGVGPVNLQQSVGAYGGVAVGELKGGADTSSSTLYRVSGAASVGGAQQILIDAKSVPGTR